MEWRWGSSKSVVRIIFLFFFKLLQRRLWTTTITMIIRIIIATNNKQQAANNKQETRNNNQQPTTNNQQPTTNKPPEFGSAFRIFSPLRLQHVNKKFQRNPKVVLTVRRSQIPNGDSVWSSVWILDIGMVYTVHIFI